MHTHGARKIDALDALAFALSARRVSVHSRDETNRQYDAATNYLKGEHANMEQALRTEITIELGHKPDAKAGPFAGHKPPVVHIECVHEGIADDDAHAALWHDEAVTAATQAAAALMQKVGLAPEPPEPPRGTVFVTVKGDASGLMRAITEAEQSLRADARRGHTPGRPFVGPTLDAPRYSHGDLETIAIEVACAMFGDAYRDWLDSDDEHAVATRERGAGALHAAAYVEHMRHQS